MSTQRALDDDWGTTSVDPVEPADAVDVEAQRRDALNGGARYGRSSDRDAVEREPESYVCDGCGRSLAGDERNTARVMGDSHHRVPTCGECDDVHDNTSSAVMRAIGGER